MSGLDDVRNAIETARVLAFRPKQDSPQENAVENGAGGGGVSPPPGVPDPADPHLPFAVLPMTDLGNAERFAGRWIGRFRYCPAIGWLAWNGKFWSKDISGEKVMCAVHETVRHIQQEGLAVKNEPGLDFFSGGKWWSERLQTFGRRSEAKPRLSAIADLARTKMTISLDELDRDSGKINVLNGTLCIDKAIPGYVKLKPHDSKDFITRIATVIYDPSATCPLFDAFLRQVQPDPSVQSFLLCWFGYSLTGFTFEQKMVFLYGKGRNGKGVLVNTFMEMAGDYADAIPIEAFLESGRARAAGQATPELACLPGVRLLTTSEPKQNATLDEAFVKLFTGGDRIKARHLNRDFFSFIPVAKLTMQGNYRPKVKGSDEGIWSRIQLIHFPITIPSEQRDPHLQKKLGAEGAGILNRLLDGLRQYLDEGLVPPAAVLDATDRYRSDSDPLGRFIKECIERSSGNRVETGDMYLRFEAWAKANGEYVWTHTHLSRLLKEQGFVTIKSNGRLWLDVRLKA